MKLEDRDYRCEFCVYREQCEAERKQEAAKALAITLLAHNDGLAESEEAIKALQESLAEKEEELAKKDKIIQLMAEVITVQGEHGALIGDLPDFPCLSDLLPMIGAPKPEWCTEQPGDCKPCWMLYFTAQAEGKLADDRCQEKLKSSSHKILIQKVWPNTTKKGKI